MRFQDIPTNPDTKTLRQFAAMWIVFFGAIGGWQLYNGGIWGWPIVALTLGGGILGLIWPKLLKPIFVTWMILAFPIGWLVSHVMLALMFYGAFTPLGFILRATGHDPLRLRKSASDSYWSAKKQQTDPRRYLKQF